MIKFDNTDVCGCATINDIIPPENGWKQKTYYVVDVSFFKGNPVHRRIFYSGFLEDDTPGAYNQFFCSDNRRTINDIYYLKVIEEIKVEGITNP
jgi:hypothetical protein